MADDKSLEDQVAPIGVDIPDTPDADTSEESGDGSSAKFFKGLGEPNTDKWKNRRHMAWIALATLIIGTMLLWFVVPDNRLDHISGITDWFYISMVTIVGAYIGFASIPLFNKGNH